MKGFMRWLSVCALAGGSLFLGTAFATPTNFSFTGNLSQDDDVQLFNFTVGTSSNVILRTWSYAGGTNAAGQAIPEGGFDPILALFDSNGNYIDQNDDGGCGVVAADSVTGNCWDTYLEVPSVQPGNYTVSVMLYPNFANGPTLSDGFAMQGQGNFTGSHCGVPGGSFLDYAGGCVQRTSFWAFDILGAEAAGIPSGPPGPPPTGVPEPSELAFMMIGLLAVAFLSRRRRRY